MKTINNIIIFFDKLINFFIIIFLILCLAFSFYAIYDTYAVYQEAVLSDDILKFRPSEEKNFSIESLKSINEDICGWIRIDGTNMDYPVLIGEDNSEYINKNYKKEYSLTGSIFLDYRNNKMFNDDYSIIYGHNLKADLMFAEIHNYDSKEFFDTHLKGKLYTENQIYDITIYAYALVNAYDSKLYGLSVYNNGNNTNVIEYFKNNSIYKNNIDIKAEDKLLLLSTCNSVGGDDRSVLLSKISLVEESNIINEDSNITLEKIDNQLERADRQELTPIVYKNEKEKFDIKKYFDFKHIVAYEVIIIAIIIIIIKRRKKKQRMNSKKYK